MYENIKKAYEKIWGKCSEEIIPPVSGNTLKDFPQVRILLFPPTRTQDRWIYASLGMSDLSAGTGEYVPEVHIYSNTRNESVVIAISALMEHVQEHPINFSDIFPCETEGTGLQCRNLLAAFPFPDGEGFPEIEYDGREVYFIWLIPVTDSEISFLKKAGYDALEDKLYGSDTELWNWNRKPVV